MNQPPGKAPAGIGIGTDLAQLLILASSATLAGWLWGHTFIFLSGGLALSLAWHLLQLIRLIHWLRSGKLKSAPRFPKGLWQTLAWEAQRLRLRNRKRKRRMAQFLTGIREASQMLPDAFVVLGRRDEIQWCNPAAAPLLNLEWPRDAGRPLTQLIKEPALGDILASLEVNPPLIIPSPGNSASIISLYLTPFFGNRNRRLLIARDITRTYHLDRSRRDFIANASHELRTPITVLSGFIENLLHGNYNTETMTRSLSLMHQQAQRMGKIVEDLQELSRLEMDDRGPAAIPVAVAAILLDIAAEARALSADHGHAIDLEADPDLCIRGDQGELRSAFSNLVFNAVRHTPDHTRIWVTWQREGDNASLTVKDDGQGIAARHLPRLAERFYRVDKARSKETGGTGLGLSIVKHVLGRHGAVLRIRSQEGLGSSFSCDFPASSVCACDEPSRIETGTGQG